MQIEGTNWNVNPSEDYEYGEHYLYSGNYITLTDPTDDDSDDDGILDGPEFLYLWRYDSDGPFANSDSSLSYKDTNYDINQKDSDMDGLADGEENWNFDDIMDYSLVGYYYSDSSFLEPLYVMNESRTDFNFTQGWLSGVPWENKDGDGMAVFYIILS